MPEKVRSLRLQQEKVSRFLDYQEIITNGRFLRDPARNLLVIEIVKNILTGVEIKAASLAVSVT